MSLQLSTRVNGLPLFLFGDGAIPSDASFMGGMALDSAAGIYSASSGTVFTTTNGYAFGSDGRLLVAISGTPTRYVNGIPVDDSGFLCAGGVVTESWSNGLPMAGDGAIAAWSPVYLFAGGADGFYSDLVTMWQDTSGTVPADDVGETVARVDDLSGNGNNLLQGTGAAEPTRGQIPRGGRVNRLAYTEDISNAAWSKVLCTTPDFETLIPDNAQALTGASIQSVTVSKEAASQQWTVSAEVESFGFDEAQILIRDAGNLNNRVNLRMSLVTGDIEDLAALGTFSSPLAEVEDLGAGRWVISVSGTTGTETSIAARVLARDSVATNGNGSDGIKVTKLQLNRGGPKAYQRVNAAWDVTETGLISLRTLWNDGLDDYLAASITATNIASTGCLIACAVQHNTGVSNTAHAVISLGNTGGNNPVVTLRVGSTTNKIELFVRNTDGTASATIEGPTLDARLHVVLAYSVDNVWYFRVDGEEYSGTVAGSITVNCIAFGALQRTTVINFAPVSIVEEGIVRFGTVTPQLVSQTERDLVNKVGVTLP